MGNWRQVIQVSLPPTGLLGESLNEIRLDLFQNSPRRCSEGVEIKAPTAPSPLLPQASWTYLLKGELLCEDLVVAVGLDSSPKDAQHFTAGWFQKLWERNEVKVKEEIVAR